MIECKFVAETPGDPFTGGGLAAFCFSYQNSICSFLVMLDWKVLMASVYSLDGVFIFSDNPDKSEMLLSSPRFA